METREKHHRGHRAPWQWGGHLGALISGLLGVMLWVKVRRNKNPVMKDYSEQESSGGLSPQIWQRGGRRGKNKAGGRADQTPVRCFGFLADCRECQSSLESVEFSQQGQNITPVTALDRGTEEREEMGIMGENYGIRPGQMPLMAHCHWWLLWQQMWLIEINLQCTLSSPLVPPVALKEASFRLI